MTPTRPVARIAHRGNSYASLENTLDASASAMEIGCDWLELDVQTTRDDRLVVLHDETLWRLWGQGARVADCDLAEVRGLGFGDETIPLLSEALDLVRGRDVGVLIDSTTPQDTLAAHRVASGVAGVRTMYCGATEAMLALREADPATDAIRREQRVDPRHRRPHRAGPPDRVRRVGLDGERCGHDAAARGERCRRDHH
ncbi:MAG TPA: glycerophosphodiester phosphodiesterase family protein [Propionibacteriaceae bacterium]|jgi:myo-inositol-1(or 4)-monophosphatase/deoxyribonuclease-2